jgi:Flp pilus assembly protein TadB
VVNPSDLAEATRRAEYLVEHGPTVVVMSQQAGIAVSSVLWVVGTAPAAFRLNALVWFLLAVAGTVVAVTAWVRARRHGRLLPYVVETPEQPLGALTPADRKSVTRQVSGRAPVTPEAVPLVRAMLAWQRRSTRMVYPTLVGLGLGLFGFAGSTLATPGPWRWLFVVLIVCTAAFVTVLSMIEKRRRERVLAEIDRAGAPVS